LLSVGEIFTVENRVLWTGGWDSTFQILRLIIIKEVPVQPVYVLNQYRRAASKELAAIKKIEMAIDRDFPNSRSLLKPIEVHSLENIDRNSEISALWDSVRRLYPIGRQYGWLARFCTATGYRQLQLCIHRDDKAHDAISEFVTLESEDCFHVGEEFSGTPIYELFKYYQFPVFAMSKEDMGSLAKENGFFHIMCLTWFCHNSIDDKPCGVCNPCRYTVEEGLGWRLPLRSRLIAYALIRIWQPAKALLSLIRKKN
jgi:7-cyano-7-deazaguanine synthase in queuosine biosynthesis